MGLDRKLKRVEGVMTDAKLGDPWRPNVETMVENREQAALTTAVPDSHELIFDPHERFKFSFHKYSERMPKEYTRAECGIVWEEQCRLSRQEQCSVNDERQQPNSAGTRVSDDRLFNSA